MGPKSIFGKLIQFAGFGVPFDLLVEQPRLKLVEPSPEFGKLFGTELRHCFPDVFNRRHGREHSTQLKLAAARGALMPFRLSCICHKNWAKRMGTYSGR